MMAYFFKAIFNNILDLANRHIHFFGKFFISYLVYKFSFEDFSVPFA